MSTFSCICGKVTHSDDEPRDASGVLYSLADLQKVEERVENLIAEYVAAPDRHEWVRGNFGAGYLENPSDRDVIGDILSRELNDTFTSVFRCPHCGRIAMKGSEQEGWQFFEAARPAG